MSRVAVVMSTYNGAAYIAEQLESILTQTYQDFLIVIVDDFSTDETMKIVDRFVQADKRISCKRNDVNLGVNGSFQEALRSAPKCDYYCLADQDDVWPCDRIERFLDAANKSNEAGIKTVPTLFVCQYQTFVTDSEEAGVISGKLLGIDKKDIDWKRTLIGGNALYGCCFFFNHQLKSLIEKIPRGKTTHDYWIALVAAYMGRIVILPFIGTLYRQHSSNASYGAPSNNWIVKLKRIKRSIREDIRSRSDMSLLFSELLAQYRTVLSEKENNRLECASKSYRRGAMSLFIFQVKQRAWRLNRSGNVLRMIACFIQMVQGQKISR